MDNRIVGIACVMTVVIVCPLYTVWSRSVVNQPGKSNMMGGVEPEPIANTTPRVESVVSETYGTDQPCTLDMFTAYYKTHHNFPNGGVWTKEENARFQPDFCALNKKSLDKSYIKRCVKAANISSVLVIGDSNSGRYFRALLHLMDTEPISRTPDDKSPVCSITKIEKTDNGWFPNKTYYSIGHAIVDDAIRTNYQYCGNCLGMQGECNYNFGKDGNKSISIERYPLTSLIDTSISLLVPQKNTKDHHEYWAPTSAEYLLRYYLKDRYPDVIFFFVPFSHIKQGSNTVDRARGDMEYFHFFVKTFVPKTTKMFYLTTPAEHDKDKPTKWKNALFQGMLGTEKIDKLNHMMYGVLKNDLESEESNIYGSFDHVALGKTRGHWSLDGIHMETIWYDVIMSNLMEVICNSAMH